MISSFLFLCVCLCVCVCVCVCVNEEGHIVVPVKTAFLLMKV